MPDYQVPDVLAVDVDGKPVYRWYDVGLDNWPDEHSADCGELFERLPEVWRHGGTKNTGKCDMHQCKSGLPALWFTRRWEDCGAWEGGQSARNWRACDDCMPVTEKTTKIVVADYVY